MIHSIRILVIENDVLVSRALMLARTYYELPLEVISKVNNNLDIIQLVQELKPDGVIADVPLPESDDLVAIQQIKRISPETKVIILAMSDQLKHRALAAGADGFLCKSVGISELVSTVVDVMNQRLSNVENTLQERA